MPRKRLRPPKNETPEERDARLQAFIDEHSDPSMGDDLVGKWFFTFRGSPELQKNARDRIKKGEMD